MKRAWTKGWIAAAIALAAISDTGDRRCAKAKPPRCTHGDENSRGSSGRRGVGHSN
jgi:hypothetical protein